MNKELLVFARRHLMDQLSSGKPLENKINAIILSLADMCSAIGFDTEDERTALENELLP